VLFIACCFARIIDFVNRSGLEEMGGKRMTNATLMATLTFPSRLLLVRLAKTA
jgi:hypothetical protein